MAMCKMSMTILKVQQNHNFLKPIGAVGKAPCLHNCFHYMKMHLNISTSRTDSYPICVDISALVVTTAQDVVVPGSEVALWVGL
jgi:hypothetical protein